jgi:hypothetical protein
MRENRTCGSEGGEAGQPAFPTPIFGLRKQFTNQRVFGSNEASSLGTANQATADPMLKRRTR